LRANPPASAGRCGSGATGEHFADAEQGDRQDDELDPVEQPHEAEVEPGDAGLRVDADCPEQQSQDAGRQPLQEGRSDGGERRQAEDHEGEVFGRPEGQRGARERRRE
jgi:hypothetical protein